MTYVYLIAGAGADPGGGCTRHVPPPEKIWFFGIKSRFFTRNPQQFSCLPPLGAIFLSSPPPNLKSWIRPWGLFCFYQEPRLFHQLYKTYCDHNINRNMDNLLFFSLISWLADVFSTNRLTLILKITGQCNVK